MKEEIRAMGAYLLKSFNGWVSVEAKGPGCLKFLNICTRRGVRIRKTERIDEETVRADIPAWDYRKQGRQIARKAGCRIRLTGRSGTGLTLHRYRRRRFLLIGVPLCLALVLYFNSVIWQINITGGKAQDRVVTENMLIEGGVRPGGFLWGLDTQKLADSLLEAQADTLSWVGIRRVGNTLDVELASGTFYPEQSIPQEVPCNIVADRAGVISKIIPSAGTAAVQKGDVVEKGQLLVSGLVNVNDDYVTTAPELCVHAKAQIQAVVTHTVSVPVVGERRRVTQTGREDASYVLYLPGFSVKWPFWRQAGFDHETVVYTDSFGKGPFGIRKIFYQETASQTVEMDYEEALQWAKESAGARLNEEIPENALILDSSVRVEDDTVIMTVLSLEEIGVLSFME